MDLGISGSSARRRGGFDSSPVQASPKVDDGAGVKKPFSIEEAQGINKHVGAASPVDQAAKVSQTHQNNAKNTVSNPPRETIARPISRTDIIDQLVKLQKAPTQHNIEMITTILQFGLEASTQNFDTIQTLMKGRKSANALESSVISLSKGLGETPRSVDIVSQFLNKQLQISQQLQQLQGSMSQFQLAMNLNSGLFNSGFLANFGAILGELDGTLKKLNKSGTNPTDLNGLSRGQLISDFKSLYEFLGGLQQKIAPQPGQSVAQFMSASSNLQSTISGFLESLTSHAIMSEQVGANLGGDRFGYWQIPNPMGIKQPPIELLIRKDPLKKKTAYNENKTRIIVKLDTPDLGELAVSLDILDKKVWMQVNAERASTRQLAVRWINDLKFQLAAKDYELIALQTSEQKLDIKQLLAPRLNLDMLSRISTEV